MADGTAFAIGGVDAKAMSPYLINPESLFQGPHDKFCSFFGDSMGAPCCGRAVSEVLKNYPC